MLRACEESRIQMHELELPVNLTVWVDPGEVSYRLHFWVPVKLNMKNQYISEFEDVS